MIGIVISDTFLVVGVWSEEKNDLALLFQHKTFLYVKKSARDVIQALE